MIKEDIHCFFLLEGFESDKWDYYSYYDDLNFDCYSFGVYLMINPLNLS